MNADKKLVELENRIDILQGKLSAFIEYQINFDIDVMDELKTPKLLAYQKVWKNIDFKSQINCVLQYRLLILD